MLQVGSSGVLFFTAYHMIDHPFSDIWVMKASPLELLVRIRNGGIEWDDWITKQLRIRRIAESVRRTCGV